MCQRLFIEAKSAVMHAYPLSVAFVTCFVSLIAFQNASAQEERSYAYAEATQPNKLVARPDVAKVELEVVSERVRTGAKLQIRVLITNQRGHPLRVANPFLHPLVTPAVLAVAVFDDEPTCVADLLLRREGSRVAIGEGDILTLPPDGVVGKSLTLRLNRNDGKPLAPGNYYVQAILLRRFVAWDDDNESEGELARSAIKRIQIVE